MTSLVASGTGITAGAGDLHAGAVVTLTANLSQAVTVTGGRRRWFSTTAGRNLHGGSGTCADLQLYGGCRAGHRRPGGVFIRGQWRHPGGVSSGAAADLSGAVTNPAGVLQIDTATPLVTSLVASGTGITAGAGNLHAGAVVTLTANLSQAVTVTADPDAGSQRRR